MRGAGTDEKAVFEALKGRTEADLDAIQTHFGELSGGVSLDSWLRMELTPVEHLRLKIWMKAKAADTTLPKERQRHVDLWDPGRQPQLADPTSPGLAHPCAASLLVDPPQPLSEVSIADINVAIDRASAHLRGLQGEDGHWNFTYFMGDSYASQYFLTDALLKPDTKLDPKELQATLQASQRPDGTWSKLPDPSIDQGDLDATIVNYYALKASGLSTELPSMRRARQAILARGGVEESKPDTKLLLAMFGAAKWGDVGAIPYALIDRDSMFNVYQFAQWVPSNFIPVAYLRNVEYAKDLGNSFRLNELYKDNDGLGPNEPRETPAPKQPGPAEEEVILHLLDSQLPHGSFGGYGSSTMLSALALEHFRTRSNKYSDRIDNAIDRAYKFTDDVALKNLQGIQTDGRYWDTALVATALADTEGVHGVSTRSASPQLQNTAAFLAANQTASGGFPFGLDFEAHPDTDDTAEIATTLAKIGTQPQAVDAALSWLSHMQSDDGGFAAFEKNAEGSFLMKQILGQWAPPSFFYDESSADVTGHVLEAFAAAGRTPANSATMRRGIEYLKDSQQTNDAEDGMWQGRWGVNYIYGTSAALIGLLQAGESPSEPYIKSSLDWLRSVQNVDGGFGETTASYDDIELAGVGVSTPTQTAWAIMPLIEAGMHDDSVVKKAVDYLVNEHRQNGRWEDASVTGTGHPGTVYLEYRSYPHSFPLMALSRYRDAVAATNNDD